jgi:hypothetical protein
VRPGVARNLIRELYRHGDRRSEAHHDHDAGVFNVPARNAASSVVIAESCLAEGANTCSRVGGMRRSFPDSSRGGSRR